MKYFLIFSFLAIKGGVQMPKEFFKPPWQLIKQNKY